MRVSILQTLNDWLLGALVNAQLDADARAERARRRRHNMRSAMPWLIWLLLVLVGSLVAPWRHTMWLRILTGFALVPPIVAIGWIRVREVQQADELERRIELLAMAAAFAVGLCAFLLMSLLQIIQLPITLRPLWAFWLLFACYLLVQRHLHRRYR